MLVSRPLDFPAELEFTKLMNSHTIYVKKITCICDDAKINLYIVLKVANKNCKPQSKVIYNLEIPQLFKTNYFFNVFIVINNLF